jgi:hypothetical protein
MKGTVTTQSQRKDFGSRELSNQTTPTERTAIRSAPEPSDNDSRSVFIRGASILRISKVTTGQLEDLTERFRGGSRGVSVGRVDVGKGGIERAVPEVLANQEGIRALLDHEHRGGVLQNVRVL